MVAGQYHLAVTVASAFPLALTGVDVETSQNSFIQPVNIPVVKYGAVELVLHVDVFPDRRRGETLPTSLHFHQRGAFAVTGRNKETVLVDDDWLRNVDAAIRIPRITPEQSSVFGNESDDA